MRSTFDRNFLFSKINTQAFYLEPYITQHITYLCVRYDNEDVTARRAWADHPQRLVDLTPRCGDLDTLYLTLGCTGPGTLYLPPPPRVYWPRHPVFRQHGGLRLTEGERSWRLSFNPGVDLDLKVDLIFCPVSVCNTKKSTKGLSYESLTQCITFNDAVTFVGTIIQLRWPLLLRLASNTTWCDCSSFRSVWTGIRT